MTTEIAEIIELYGPGPRIHCHIGMFVEEGDERVRGGIACDLIRAEIVAAQERLLQHAASVWAADTTFNGALLDVGCGVGGGAIYWSQHFPVRVTAVTNVPEQAEATRRFAADAGVSDRVCPVAADVRDLKPTEPYSAAVAVESSCYVPRQHLFQRIAAALRPGGVFGIADVFLVQEDWCGPFNHCWGACIGSMPEYAKAAIDAGMVLEQDVDITASTTAFWLLSMSWAWARLAESTSSADQVKLGRALRWYKLFLRGWGRGYRYHILRFRKPG